MFKSKNKKKFKKNEKNFSKKTMKGGAQQQSLSSYLLAIPISIGAYLGTAMLPIYLYDNYIKKKGNTDNILNKIEKLTNDKKILLKAIRSNVKLFNEIPIKFKEDEEFILKALEKTPLLIDELIKSKNTKIQKMLQNENFIKDIKKINNDYLNISLKSYI